ncbi:hypothetical protein DMP15_29915 [Pseudonocardia sp. UM4_GMWB1]
MALSRVEPGNPRGDIGYLRFTQGPTKSEFGDDVADRVRVTMQEADADREESSETVDDSHGGVDLDTAPQFGKVRGRQLIAVFA